MRLRLELLNRGPQAAEGILLKYSLSARVSPASGKGEGAWAVAFLLDERRVPKVGPNQTKEVILDPSQVLGAYLQRMLRSGYAVNALKVMVMVEPRPGDVRALETLESILSVEK